MNDHGLYHHDCRYLNTYDLKISETNPSGLVSSAHEGYAAIFELTNLDIRMIVGHQIPGIVDQLVAIRERSPGIGAHRHEAISVCGESWF